MSEELENTFHNDPVVPESLPAHENVPLSPVSERFATYSVVKQAIVWGTATFILALSLIAGHLPENLGAWTPAAALSLGAVLGFVSWLDARRRMYGLREHDLIYASGLLIRKTVILPLARVQHVETASGPLERHFNLVRLTCYTAGGLGADLVISGLERDPAERLRQFLLSRIHEQDTPETDDAAHGQE